MLIVTPLDDLLSEIMGASAALTNCYRQLFEMRKMPEDARKNPPKTTAEFEKFMQELVDCANVILEALGVFEVNHSCLSL